MRLFSLILLALILLNLAIPAMGADPIEAGKEIVSGGIQSFFTDAADSIFAWGGNSNETIEAKERYGYAVGSVFKIAAYKHDPYESSTVQEMRKRTAIIGIFIFVLFIFYGASCVNLSCSGMGWIERAQFIVSETPFDQYKNTLIRTFASIFLVHYIFKFIILFNAATTTQTMFSVADSIQLTQDHWIMYVMMSLCYGGEFLFFGMRMLLMDLLAGSDILVGALFAFAFTRSVSVESVKYFGKITLLQFIIVLITAFGIAIIDEFPMWAQTSAYLGLLIVLFVISAILMFGFTRIFKTVKMIAKGAFL